MNTFRKSGNNKNNIKKPSSSKIVKVNNPAGLHPRNKHLGRYDFAALVNSLPELKEHVVQNPKGEQSINFSDPIAVKLLNKALLNYYYNITEWDIPQGYLCPPIPGRADYIHRAAELLTQECKGLKHHLVRALDIGVGANCIYPIVGATEYGWQYTASDVDPISVETANKIANNNAVLTDKVECRLQNDSRHFFKNIIRPGEYYDITTCNPPFHKSLLEAQQGTDRKLKNLRANRSKRGHDTGHVEKNKQPVLNFGGQKAELWCPGGEAEFIKNMALESKNFADQVLWFSTLISKRDNVRWMCKNLEKVGAIEIQVVEMAQGQKVSRFIAWTFKSHQQRLEWLTLKCRT